MDTYPFLSNLGVSDIAQARNPTADAFPPNFNVNCKQVWDRTISLLPLTEDVCTNWGQAIRDFIENCIEADLYPFSDLKQSVNDQIMASLMASRKALLKDFTKMLCSVKLGSTIRSVEMNNLGFTLKTCSAVTLKDPTFGQWLTQAPYPRFVVRQEDFYIKQIDASTNLFASKDVDKWSVGYEIVCKQFPSIPGNPLPTRLELEKFILNVLLMPVLKIHRPDGFHHRLV